MAKTTEHKPFLKSIMETDVIPDNDRLDAYKANRFVFPDNLELHLGPVCQCSCVFCWRWKHGAWNHEDLGLYREHPNVPLLSQDDITNLLQEFKSHGGKRLFFSGGLEFFTSPHSTHAVKICNQLGLKIRIYTNGVAECFDDRSFRKLLLESAEYIRFSVHSNTSDTYARVQMPHRNYDEVVTDFNNVRIRIAKLLEERQESCGAADLARIRISFLALGDNYSEILPAIEYFRDLGVDSFYVASDMREASDWFNASQRRSFDLVMEDIRERKQRGEIEPLLVLGDRHEPRVKVRFPAKCYVPYKHPAVDPWGHVYSCCYRVNPALQFPDYAYGKFPEMSLYDILRNAHDQHRIPRPQCAQCPDWELGYNQCIEKTLIK
jgi:MoaA/NifB/PqqE/SkfB family radical SAM enzyme